MPCKRVKIRGHIKRVGGRRVRVRARMGCKCNGKWAPLRRCKIKSRCKYGRKKSGGCRKRRR